MNTRTTMSVENLMRHTPRGVGMVIKVTVQACLLVLMIGQGEAVVVPQGVAGADHTGVEAEAEAEARSTGLAAEAEVHGMVLGVEVEPRHMVLSVNQRDGMKGQELDQEYLCAIILLGGGAQEAVNADFFMKKMMDTRMEGIQAVTLQRTGEIDVKEKVLTGILTRLNGITQEIGFLMDMNPKGTTDRQAFVLILSKEYAIGDLLADFSMKIL